MRSRLHNIFASRPVAAAVAILIADIVLSLLFTVIARQVAPGANSEFVTLALLTVITLAFVTCLGWWRVAGFNAPSAWRNLGVLVLPAVVIVVPPLLGGLKAIEPGNLLYLVVAYTLVGLREEALWRGVVLHGLKPLGTARAAILTGVLFGLSHLANLAVRSSPVVVIAQVIGAICDGIGFSVLRLRTQTIWFLIALHALHDLLLQLTALPSIPLDVVQVTILLLYGLYLLRRYPGTSISTAVAPAIPQP
jgi:hypothetical protein